MLAYAERHVLRTRTGTNGIVEEDIDGAVAAVFTHYDSRAGDPQLHDHVVVWNRARTTADGKWRTLDSRGLFRHAVALSELHQGVLSDLLTDALGVGWDSRTRRHSPRPRWEITGVPETLLAEFSSRAEQIEARRAEFIAEFQAAHGRDPTQPEILRIRQRATIDTRPDKTHRSLAEMTAAWRHQAVPYVGSDGPVAWVQTLTGRNDLPVLRASDFAPEMLADAATVAAANVAEARSTFTRANLLAEAHRLYHGVRFATPDDRVAVVEATADLAAEASVRLNPPELHHTPVAFLRPDGTSKIRPASRHVFTAQALLDAEARLLETGRRTDGLTIPLDVIAAVCDAPAPAGTTPSASTRLSPSRSAAALAGPSTSSSVRPEPGSRPQWLH